MKMLFSRIRILFALFLSLAANALVAQPVLRGQINFGRGQHTGRLNIQGNYLFLTLQNSDLRILNIADPSRPTLVGQVRLGDESAAFYGTDVEILGDFAYVRSGFGIAIVNIRDKTNPALITRLALSSEPLSLDLADGLLYVGTTGDLSIFSLGTPTFPLLIGSYPASGQIREVVVANRTAYCAAHGAGFLVIDVSNPSAPALAARVPNDSSAAALDLALDGNRAYVATDYELKIFDVSNPAAPKLLGKRNLGVGFFSYRDAVAYSAGYVFLHGFGSYFQVVDVRNPADPRIVKSALFPGSVSSGADLLADGNRLFVADGTGGLRIFDIADPAAPQPISNHIVATEIRSVQLTASLAYAANAFGEILVIDCASPNNPRVIARVPTLFPPRFLVASNGRLFSVFQDGFELFDLQNPLLPTLAGRYLGPIADVASLGNYAFVSRDGRLDTFDISNPSAFAVAASYTDGYFGILDLSGPFLATRSSAGVTVFNVSNPLALRPIGSYSENPTSLDFDGNVLFVQGQTVTPALRVSQNSVVLAGSAPSGSNLSADSGRFWVARDNLTLVDARNISNAITIGSVPLASPLYDLSAHSSFAATAHGSTFALYEGALPNPQLETSCNGTELTIRWPVTFSNYNLYVTPTLGAGWQIISPPFPQQNGYFTYTDPLTSPTRFFRLQVP